MAECGSRQLINKISQVIIQYQSQWIMFSLFKMRRSSEILKYCNFQQLQRQVKMAEKATKTKIIYNTLENLIRSSSLSKTKTEQTQNSISKNATLQRGNVTSKSSVKQSIGRHVLKSKENLLNKIGSQSKSKEKLDSSSQYAQLKTKALASKKYFQEVQKIYIELELALHHSKKQFLNKIILSSENQATIDEDFKRLVDKSTEIKLLLAKTTQCETHRHTNYQQPTPNALPSGELENISYLSKANRKNINASRLNRKVSNKKLTLYEEILKKNQ